MTADSSTATVTRSGDEIASVRNSLPSPWAQVVRGGNVIEPTPEPDSDSIPPVSSPVIADPVTVDTPAPAETQPEGFDGGSNCNAGGVTRSAWSKPSANGVVEAANSPVMGAASWPALSESTRPGVKSFSESSSKQISDGSAAISQAPVIPQPPPKQGKVASNSHSNPKNTRPRPSRRGGSAGGASTGFVRPMPPSPPPLPPRFPIFNMYGNLAPAGPVPPVAPQPPFKGGNWSARHPGQRNNIDPRPVNNGYDGSRGHRGPRGSAVRDVHVPHPMAPPPPPPFRGFVRPHFFVPPPLRPYGAPLGYEMGAPYVYFPTLAQPPYSGGPPVPPHGTSASSLHDDILKQIEYYFSDDNLVKDNFLRSQMDEEGWVPIKLIAGFRRVQALTNDVQMLLSSLKDSSTVEIQGDKVRRQADWKRWTNTPREATENAVEKLSLQKLTLVDEPMNEELIQANGDVSIDDPSS
ncbi:hypothetical protein SSX86_017806 [Deinandra increscens subsp. villosa]|uniref:HTH La-type RNA-binding domain-containing protein n=1 Tax=Deinandra increscens subsp. villosa TaxID=3103831 RepID=A0AAP0CW11_9ASTR